MTLELLLPFGKKGDVKDLVFTLLTKEYPLKIIDLTKFIRKRYGKDITFQAVRKACTLLEEEGVLIKKEGRFMINRKWVQESKQIIDGLYEELAKEKKNVKMESIGEEVSVYNFNSLNEMMSFWQDLIDNWFKDFRKGNINVNVYQAAHAWEGLLHLDREKKVMGQLRRKGIKSYIVSTGNTVLDKNIRKFYTSIGVKFSISPSNSSFDKSYYVGTYGDMIIQSQYPNFLVKRLDNFFKKNKTIEKLNLKELSDIANLDVEMKLTVIKNKAMAEQINKSVLSLI